MVLKLKRVKRDPSPGGTLPPFGDCPSCGDAYDASIWHVEVVDFCGHIKCNACAMDYRFDCQECIKEKKKQYAIDYPPDYPEYLKVTHGDLEMGEEAWMEKVRKINPIFKDWKRIPIRIKEAATLYPQPEPSQLASSDSDDDDIEEINADEIHADTKEDSGNGTNVLEEVQVDSNGVSDQSNDGDVANSAPPTPTPGPSTSTDAAAADDDDDVRMITIVDMSKITEEEEEDEDASELSIPCQNAPPQSPPPPRDGGDEGGSKGGSSVPLRLLPPPRRVVRLQPPPSRKPVPCYQIPPPHCFDQQLAGTCLVMLRKVGETLRILEEIPKATATFGSSLPSSSWKYGDDDDVLIVDEPELERVTRARVLKQASKFKRVLRKKPETTTQTQAPLSSRVKSVQKAKKQMRQKGAPVPKKSKKPLVTDAVQLKCDKCGTTYSSQSNLNRHMNLLHSDSKRFMCTLCDVGFPNKKEFYSHKQTESHQRKCGKTKA